jgi:hypothetical protein
MSVRVLALDLERTLISDAMNREPRPGLSSFLTWCAEHFQRIVLFTSVNRSTAQAVMTELHQHGEIPTAFLNKLEYLDWEGKYKDLTFIPNAEVKDILFIDDDPGWIAPGQESQHIAIAEYDPYLVKGKDKELERVRQILARIKGKEKTS